MSAQEIFELRLTDLSHGGEGIGRLPDGRVVFVPFALPGETVRVRLIEEKPRYARGQVVELLSPAAERVAPRCRHFGECGGCQLQHLDYGSQLTAKAAILRLQLERVGKLIQPPVQPAVSAQPWNYRNHVQFHLTPQGQLGYYRHQSQQVMAIQECHLPEEPLGELWPRLDFEAIPEIERLGLRLGLEGDLMLVLESRDLQAPEISVEELPISVVHLSPAGPLVLAGSSTLLMEVLGRRFRVSAGSFFQVNTPIAAKMVSHVLESLPLSNHQTVMDVYCGVGLFSAFLAERCGRLVGVEQSPQACSDFAVNLDEFDHVELYEGPAEELLPHIDVRPDVVLVDPPRAGLAPAALQAIIAKQPARLVYISCDPSTLARDARSLSLAGYHLIQVTPFDLFPQTYHIESISYWEWGKR